MARLSAMHANWDEIFSKEYLIHILVDKIFTETIDRGLNDYIRNFCKTELLKILGSGIVDLTSPNIHKGVSIYIHEI